MLYFVCFFVSMLPIIELRGAIPLGIIHYKLNTYLVYLASILGNILIIPFIYYIFNKILVLLDNRKWLGKITNKIIKKAHHAGEKIKQKKSIYIALFIFTAIPLPGTGAWTATLAASFLKIDFKKTIISVSLGVLTAGIIIYLISLGIFNFF